MCSCFSIDIIIKPVEVDVIYKYIFIYDNKKIVEFKCCMTL